MNGTSSSDVPPHRAHSRRRCLSGGLGVAVVTLCVGLGVFMSLEAELVTRVGGLAPVAVFLIQAATVVAVPVPAWPVTAVAVLLYGPWFGFGLSYAGTVCGSTAAFLLGRRFGWALIRRIGAVHDHVIKLEHSDGLWLIPVLTLPIPVGGDLACFVAGLSAVRCRRFVWLACIGRIPGTTLGVLTAAGFTNGSTVLVVAAMAVLMILVLLARRWKAPRASAEVATASLPAEGSQVTERREGSGEHSALMPLPRPVAFVFGAGGSHGAVQVGQLRALREFGVQPDFLVGCSVGALNAATFAVEPDNAPERLEALWTKVGADDVFSRSGPPIHQRRAVFGNKRLRYLLEEHLSAHNTVDGLTLRLFVVATDRKTKQPHVLHDGDLIPALLASCAIPFLLPAVTIGTSHLVDGGIRHDLPIGEAFDLGAASVVALPTTRWPRPIGYRSSRGVDDHRVLVLGGAARPGTGWCFTRTDELIEQGYQEASQRLAGYSHPPLTMLPDGARQRT